MSTSENQMVVYQPNETVRLDVRAEIIPGLLASIRKATSERREYGKGDLQPKWVSKKSLM